MGIDAIITISVIVVAMILFIIEVISVDIVALGIMIVLVLSGVITPEQGVEGFANEAVLTVLAMFVLSAAVIKSNIIDTIGPTITRFLKKGYIASVSGLTLLVGGMSAFINNTPVVATFIPVINDAAKKAKIPPSRFLIPLSFVAIFGGVCTLIGTSTNLLVSGISQEHGFGEFSMFLLTPLGLIFMVVGLIYLLLFGRKLIPEREELLEEKSYHNQINNFLTEIKYKPAEPIVNPTIKKVLGEEDESFDIIRLKRGDKTVKDPDQNFELQENDVLLAKGDLDKIKRFLKSRHLHIVEKIVDKEFPEEETKLIELILQPHSDILRKKIKEIDFRKKYQANILAIRQRGKTLFKNLGDIKLQSGDVLLIQTSERGYETFREYQKSSGSPFLILKEAQLGKVNKRSLIIAAMTIAAVITVATIGLAPISITAFTGIIALNLTGVITMEDAYKSIDWQVIFLLAGALSLEKAMSESGVSEFLGQYMVDNVGAQYGPMIVVSVIYFLTSLITGIISNNAAAVLFAPIGISIAEGLDVSPIPFLVAVAFAGSASFYTPIGYQTNTMVYSAGNYKFRDFAKVGTPLNLIFWIVATLLIPVFYPF